MVGKGNNTQLKREELEGERETDPSSSSNTSSTNLVGGRFGLGFSIEMHCSTKVLKLMCFLFPGWGVWTMRSCSLPVEVPADVVSSTDKANSADSLDNVRGGESLRSTPRMVHARRIWVSLLVWGKNGRFGCGEALDDGCGSYDDGSSGSECGAVGRERISVMLRCLRIGFV